MAINLSNPDFEALARILSAYAEWRNFDARYAFMSEVFAGSPRRAQILSSLLLEGPPVTAAKWIVRYLMDFGQDEPGREALGVLINKLLANLGGGQNADQLRTMLGGYEFQTRPAAAVPVGGWRGPGLDPAEKIIGENTLRHIYLLEGLLTRSRAVVRIDGPLGLGTGFMVAADLLMTNHHVIAEPRQLRECTFDFNYQLGADGLEQHTHRSRARTDGIFWTSPTARHNAGPEELDCTVVQLEDVPSDIAPMVLVPCSVGRNHRVSIIQHPGGSYKKVSLQNNFVEYVDDYIVQYTTSTEPGSSGSPVFNDELEVVALHHAGGTLLEPGTQRRYSRNEGIRIAAILEQFGRQAPQISERLAKR